MITSELLKIRNAGRTEVETSGLYSQNLGLCPEENYFSRCHIHTSNIIRTEYDEHTHTHQQEDNGSHKYYQGGSWEWLKGRRRSGRK